MRSILEEFAYSNISPENQYFKKNSEFGKAMTAMTSTEEKLLAKLDSEDKALFEEYVAQQGRVNQLTATKNVVYGFKLGLIMTAEAFITSNSLVAGGEEDSLT